MYSRLYTCAALVFVGAAARELFPRQQHAPTTTGDALKAKTLTGCHLHGSQLFCIAGDDEYLVHTTPTSTTNVPAQFTGCHTHGTEMFCISPKGEEVQVEPVTADEEAESDHDHEHGSPESGSGKNCHFHAGVEHCVGGEEEVKCDVPNRKYNVGLRVGLLFVILATSAIGVFGPILLQRVLPKKLNLVFTVLKQFGTGIIISTAFVHLYTHAALMFGNKCLGELEYESTTSAILMAGVFLSFCVDYVGQRIVLARTKAALGLRPEQKAQALLSTEVVSILIMEAGILFHSLLIGLTLVVAGDSFFITLFIVILFHQIFEGLALGTRIATIGTRDASEVTPHGRVQDADHDTDKSASTAAVNDTLASQEGLSMKKKLGLAALFAFITPIGMAIGIGVLQQFNGNDKSTLIAIGTLDALSAGILVWVGLVEMWAADWMGGCHGRKAELADADMLTVALAGSGLVAGLVLMSFLGKWA